MHVINWKPLSVVAVVLAFMVALARANMFMDFIHGRIDFCEKRPEVLEHGLCKYCCHSQRVNVEVATATQCKCEDWTLAKFPDKYNISVGYRVMYDYTLLKNFYIKDLNEGKIKIPG